MFHKELPFTVKLSFLISIVQFIAWPFFEYLLLNDPFPYPASRLSTISFDISATVFVLLSLPHFGLVVWELLIALKTKKYYWLVYVMAALVAVLWVITLTFHPAVAHHCGCAG